MKFAVVAMSGLLCAAVWGAPNPDLTQVKSVYFLPMANGFEQYLANRVVASSVFQVVTDPKRADAVFTDRLGQPFEDKWNELVPPPAPPEAAKKKEEDKSDASTAGGLGDTKTTGAGPTPSFGRARGTLFLVDIKTRQVLWSTYERPKNSTPRQLDRTAKEVANALAKAVKAQAEPPAAKPKQQ